MTRRKRRCHVECYSQRNWGATVSLKMSLDVAYLVATALEVLDPDTREDRRLAQKVSELIYKMVEAEL
jgi:hypothetical protein